MKAGKNIVIIGGMGQGKTYYTKSRILTPAQKVGFDLCIYDINGEYEEFKNKFDFINAPHPPEKAFMEMAVENKMTVNVFEEATYFLPHNTQHKEVYKTMQLKRHKNTFNVFLFTAIRSLPLYISAMTDQVILFKTADNIQHLKNRYEHTPIWWNAIKKAQNFRPLDFVKFNPSEIVTL